MFGIVWRKVYKGLGTFHEYCLICDLPEGRAGATRNV
jgi:hypothetical protein